MTTTFLKRDEIIQLTGAKQKSIQLKQLARQGIEFLIGRDGHPRVLRSALEERLGFTNKQKVAKEPILFGG